jgi:hypothetical protein
MSRHVANLVNNTGAEKVIYYKTGDRWSTGGDTCNRIVKDGEGFLAEWSEHASLEYAFGLPSEGLCAKCPDHSSCSSGVRTNRYTPNHAHSTAEVFTSYTPPDQLSASFAPASYTDIVFPTSDEDGACIPQISFTDSGVVVADSCAGSPPTTTPPPPPALSAALKWILVALLLAGAGVAAYFVYIKFIK